MEIQLTATKPQADFYAIDAKYPAFVAGYGSGKSEALVCSALLDSFEGGAESLIALYEPTYDLVRLILAPRLEEKLVEWGIRYRYNKSENILYTSSSQVGDFILRSLDNPARIIGYESFRAKIDELDTLKREQASLVWEKVIARNRQIPKTYVKQSSKPINTVGVFTTPEGFRFVHDRWVKVGGDDYQIIQAATKSNPYLPPDYIESLRASYPPQLIDAYLEGKFVNLTAGTIYAQYDRELNSSTEMVRDNDILHVGMDFNVGKMAAVVHVVRDGLPHAVAEVFDAYDTPDMRRILQERYWKFENGRYIKNRTIRVYPDASGGSRKSVNASETDIQILKQAGFVVVAPKANPPVKDRINSMNAMFCNADGERRYRVNAEKCPTYADCLEQQAWGKNGEPDKTAGTDHLCDGAGYYIHNQFPIVKKSIKRAKIGGI